ncbi:MAG: hypothetical protein K2Y27_35560 [Xanthobacteraceae bacterium]|nr:hypothetical protein [Xanthobacteraceae bacterium]
MTGEEADRPKIIMRQAAVFLRINSKILAGLTGVSSIRTPYSPSASSMPEMIAGAAGTVPDSPFLDSGLAPSARPGMTSRALSAAC